MKDQLHEIYSRLYSRFGPQRWWPARTRFEVIVGAILTQNTNWGNVEKAITRLREKDLLTPQSFRKISASRLSVLIKPAGYFNVKAKRLKNFIDFLFDKYAGDLSFMGRQPMEKLRKELLSVNGIGPETADSILLYAFGKPVFVVDAYTRRFLSRHNLVGGNADYDGIQEIFRGNLKPDRKMFNEYHALIVRLGKEFCRPDARCELCPLNDFHYSLVDKCGVCHRAFKRGEEFRRLPGKALGKMICGECRSYDLPKKFVLVRR